MQTRKFDEMISYFNRKVSDMYIDRKYKMELLAMITAIGMAHEKELDAQLEQRWIPCSERLPEVHESGNSFSGIYMQSIPVLVYGICEGEENAQFHVVTYCDDLDGNTYWATELDAFTINKVTAWMPLPEPYRGDDHAD